MPGIVIGVGLILAWNLPVWPVTPYNTWVILLLPYPVRYASAVLRQIGGSLEAAARGCCRVSCCRSSRRRSPRR